MRGYYRVMLGQGSVYATECFEGGFIGVDYGVHEDLSKRLVEDWRAFNRDLIPNYLNLYPHKTKVAAGLACGSLWTLAKGIREGDVVLSPTGTETYRAAEVRGEYLYVSGGTLPHRRSVHWLPQMIEPSDMSDALRRSMAYIGTVSNVSQYASEVEALVGRQVLFGTDDTVEDPYTFALEEHLEDFLVANWTQTALGKEYDVYEVDGNRVGQQYEIEKGRIDILAIRKDGRELLVVELKKGRASDAVVGQTLSYMGYVQDQLAEEGQVVKGAIIAQDDDLKIRRALMVVPNVKFYRYQVSFKLIDG